MSAATPCIFISYSSRDVALVEPLNDDLTPAGVAVWLDHEQLPPGTPNQRRSPSSALKIVLPKIQQTHPRQSSLHTLEAINRRRSPEEFSGVADMAPGCSGQSLS